MGHGLRAEPGHSQHVEDAGRDFRPHFLVFRDAPGGHVLAQEARDALADALHRLQGIARDQLAEVNGQPVDSARRGAKRPHAKLIGAAELQHVRERIQQVGRVLVRHVRSGISDTHLGWFRQLPWRRILTELPPRRAISGAYHRSTARPRRAILGGDLALLKMDGDGDVPVIRGDSGSLRVGDELATLGYGTPIP